jgi:hypothetical protein
MRQYTPFLRAAVVPVLMLVAACGTESSAPVDHANLHASAAVAGAAANADAAGLARRVASATARFNSQVQATKAGYVVSSPCVAVPGLGGMGFHWVNGALVDPVFDPVKPEAVLYDANGKLVAVEYIVIDVGQPRPSFDGHPFDIGGTPVPVPHYSLHAWVHMKNPSGMFAPFNPDLRCS